MTPFLKFGPGKLHLFWAEIRIGFDSLNDFFRATRIAAVHRIHLGKLHPQIKILRLFPGLLLQNLYSSAEMTMRQKFVNGFGLSFNFFRLRFSLASFLNRTPRKFDMAR
jgi:hypothetical protein